MNPVAVRHLLKRYLDTCRHCRQTYEDNVVILVADDGGILNNEQALAVLEHLKKQHAEGHTHDVH